MPKTYFPYLDSLRTLAFFAVFYAHSATVFMGANLSDAFPLNILKKTSVYGVYGVNFFFVLSGFLITYLLLQEKSHSESKSLSIKEFYIKRVLRIWPVYFITFFVGVFVLPFLIPESTYSIFAMTNPHMQIEAVLYNLFFSGNFYQGMGIGIASLSIGVLWSVCVEEQFYLVWPWVVKYCTPRRLAFVTALLVSLSLLFKFLYAEDRLANYYLPWSVGMDLGLGALLGIGFFLKKTKQIIWSNIAIILSSISFVAVVWKIGTWTDVVEAIRLTKSLIVDCVFVLVLLFFVNLIRDRKGLLAHTHKALSYLGKISYGLYAYHAMCLMLTLSVLYQIGYLKVDVSRSMFFVTITLSFTLSILAAKYSYLYIEKPILSLRKRFIKNS